MVIFLFIYVLYQNAIEFHEDKNAIEFVLWYKNCGFVYECALKMGENGLLP